MKTNIQIFTSEVFGEIRTCQVNNQIMFVGKDVAAALGYKNPSNALQVHVDSEDKTSYLIRVSGSKYKANTLLVNESGLYSLILSSKLPQAKAFKRWVTSEVLPLGSSKKSHKCALRRKRQAAEIPRLRSE